jgi:hypothetical protein
MSELTYRALKACLAGGVYRRPGEIFVGPAMDKIPPHLAVVLNSGDAPEAEEKPKAKIKAKAKAATGPGRDEIGLGKVINCQDVHSGDLIKD